MDATPATRTFTVDTHRAGHDHHVRPDRPDQQHERLVRVHLHEGRLDVRVPHRRRDVRGLHVAAGRTRALAEGAHTFAVRAIDTAGNVDPSPATRTFTVDTAAPDTTITSGPTGPTNSASASFAFTSTEPGATFECRLDTAAFAACTSPQAYSALAAGEHTFAVRATDAAGNVDATPATRTFTVDTTAPNTTIDSGPTGTIGVTTADVHVLELGDGLDVRVPPGRAPRSRPAPRRRPTPAWPAGEHTFAVRAIDAAGNVDATPATPHVHGGHRPRRTPPSPAARRARRATPRRRSPSRPSKAGSTFECRLDGPGAATGTYVACTSPRAVGPLADGTYTFLVRADRRGRQRRPVARDAHASRSTRRRRTRRSRAARRAPINDDVRVLRLHEPGRGRDVRVPLDSGGLRGLHVPADLHEPRRR